MDDSDQPLRLMIIEAVNECQDTELLDLIFKLLTYEENGGGASTPATILYVSTALHVTGPQ